MADVVNGKRRFAINIITNALNFVVNVFSGILVVPLLVKNIGVSEFGVVQIAIGFSIYLNLVTTSLNQGINRSLLMSLNSNDGEANAKNTLHTIFVIYGVLLLVVLLVCFIVVLNVQRIFNISTANLFETQVLFASVSISYVIVMLASALNSPLYAENKLYVIQSINIFRNSMKLLFVVAAAVMSQSIAFIGAAHLASALIGVIVSIVYFLKTAPYYSIRGSKFEFAEAKSIAGLSIWTLVSQIGVVALSQTSVLLVGMYLTHNDAGVLGVLSQWPSLVINMATITSVVLAPYVMILYSKNQFTDLRNFVIKAVYYQAIWSGLIVGVVASFSFALLSLWVGSGFSNYSHYLICMILPLAITQAIRPLYTVNAAYNEVKYFGLFYCVAGVAHVVVSYIVIRYTEFGLLGTILSSVLLSILVDGFVLPLYVARYAEIPLWMFIRSIGISLLMAFVAYLIGNSLQFFVEVHTWAQFVVQTTACFVLSLAPVFMLIKSEDRIRLLAYLRRRFAKC